MACANVERMLFVTGMQRSGTTLVGHLLDAHPAVSVMSQPFPLLFVELRREFLRMSGAADLSYPLGPQFLESSTQEEFDRFLERHALGRASMEAVFDAMEGYSGQYTRFPVESRAAALRTCPTTEFAAQLQHLYECLSPRKNAAWVGGKETLCEAYVPHLLSRGAHIIVVLRDPRDVIASLNHGQGRRWAGHPKPTLFNLRQWRKSVALVCSYRHESGFLALRYEDVVADPARELSRVMSFLGIEGSTPHYADEVINNVNGLWPGNSSFEGGGRAGRYRDVLPNEVCAYIESCCLPEMRWLGYDTSMSRATAIDTIRNYVDPYLVERAELKDYGKSLVDIDAELHRLALLDTSDDEDRIDYFVFPRTHRVLAEVLR